MVLFKRKPVRYLPLPKIDDDDAEVWQITQTGEIFATYEDYLNRMDFYKQRRFNDQITGHSGLTFFEAFTSELSGGREVEATFPEALKGPILRKVQFQTISRLDTLVDRMYEDFKQDYFPGEDVTVTIDGSERVRGLVRDKTTFGLRLLPDGSRTQPMTRYLVNLVDSKKENVVTDEHICRNRGVFTKAMLRSFIKKTVMREAWNGAPWLVKNEYASQYHIDSRVPPHLRYDTKVQERKQLQAQKRSTPADLNGRPPNLHSGPVRLPELKPTPKSHKSKHSQQASKALRWPLNVSVNGVNGIHHLPAQPQSHSVALRESSPPPPASPPPPPKYPIEDLQLEMKENGVRPRLKFMCHDPPSRGTVKRLWCDNIHMSSVGPLLETWDTLNVYCEVFRLDSFTFDDYVEAMSVASQRKRVQLFDEIHCSVLKILVDSERDGGKVRIALPELEDDASENSDGTQKDGSAEVTPEPEPKPVARATRGSLAKLEAQRLATEAAAAEEENLRAELESKHRAEELLKEFDWMDHLRRRDFANGGWQRIVVGLLHQLSKNERRKEACEMLLLQLVPPETNPTQESVRERYAGLDINYRVQVLQILCMLTMETKAVRGYMEDCSEIMTKYRKDKIEWQRRRKQTLDDLRQLNEERRVLMPETTPTDETKLPRSEEPDKAEELDDSFLRMSGDRTENGDVDHGDDGKSRRNRSGRGSSEKQRRLEEEKERKAAEKEKEAKKKAAKAAATPTKLPSQQAKQFNRLFKEIQKKEEFIKLCEEEIAVIENDLREADCPRTRVLGKDRFWNRYYWFERNGMPYAGLPNSSTAFAEYANGCIWVQGPHELEREGYIDLPAELQNEYQAKFGMTVPQRKAREEDGTSIFDATQWGYITEPEDVDRLIRWLDPRGFNELKLRKELLNYKEKIATHMEKRKEYLAQKDTKDEETAKTTMTKRTSSRIRKKTPEISNLRCLHWENTMALDELGHLHAEEPPPPRARKQTKKREAAHEPAGRGPNKARRR